MATIGVFAAIFDGDHRILCVRRAYAPHNWTLPGGRVEPGESPTDALVREVREEAGVIVEPRELIGVYATPYKDDLVLFFECSVALRTDWHPDAGIAEATFVAADELPRDLSPRTSSRIADAFAGTRGAVRNFKDESDAGTGLLARHPPSSS